MRTNHEHGQFDSPRVSGLRLNNVVLTISATYVIPENGPSVWVIDGGLADRVVRLPTLAQDRMLVVANIGSTNTLNTTDSGGSALIAIPPQSVAMFFASSSRWVWSTDSFSTDVVSITNVVGSGAVLATDVIVHVNGAGVVVLTLPTSASWLSANGGRGLPLEITDISNNASVNNITINPAGAETIGGNASLTINADNGSWQLRPKTAGGWTFR